VTQTQVHLYTVINWTLLGLDGLLGLAVLRWRWRRATRVDRPATTPTLSLAFGGRGEG
jgi:hypothetical protein